MNIPVVMPQMGESVAEGTVTKWLKRPGDNVQRDEPLLEISTDKVDSEIPAPASGVVREIRVPEGKTVPVGEVLAFIEGQAGAVAGATLAGGVAERAAERAAARGGPAPAAATTAGAPAAPAPPAGPRPAGAPEAGGPAAAEAPAGARGRFLSPLVQKLAAEAGIGAAELDSIPGTGQGGRLRREDLEKYLQARGKGAAPAAAPAPTAAPGPGIPAPALARAQPGAATAAPPGARPGAAGRPGIEAPAAAAFTGQVESIPMDTMRKAIAEHMVRSVRTSPHVTSITECDMTGIVRFRERERHRLEAAHGVKLTYMPFIARAVVQSIAAFPWVNSEVEGETIKVKHFVNLGIAVALDKGGLIVPVVREAHRKGFWDLAREIDDLARRARERKLKPDEVHEGTFTITNPGVFGGLIGTPIINQPQAAILALGAVTKRPVVLEDDAVAVRSMMYLSLSYDHRVVDGALGVRFLEHLRQGLEKFDLSEAG